MKKLYTLVMNSKYCDIFALTLNLAGTILILFSFQASSSEFRLVKTQLPPAGMRVQNHSDSLYSICVNKDAMLEYRKGEKNRQVMMGSNIACDGGDTQHVAIVTSNHPTFGFFGLVASMLGFLLQGLILLFRM